MALTKIVNPAYAAEEKPASDEYKKLARDAATALDDGFPWDETAEGYNFWESVYSRLLAISNGEPL